MKYLFLILMTVLSLTSCKNLTKGSSSGALKAEGQAAPAQLPPNDMYETNVLTSRFWVFEHWIDVDNPENKSNKGRWYRFYEDGTYDGGHWEDHNDHGTWYLQKGEEYTELLIDSGINDYLDAKWEVQGISSGQDAMSWVKTVEYGDGRAAMCKLMPLLSIPTKEQFGVQ